MNSTKVLVATRHLLGCYYSHHLQCCTSKVLSRNVSFSSSVRSTERSHSENSASTNDDNPSFENAKFYDVVIAGGGLVGTTLAVALAQSPRLANQKILLLESAKETWTKGPTKSDDEDNTNACDFSNRVVAISPGSKRLLENLGIWDEIWRYQEVTNLQVWDALSGASISFKNPEYESPVSYIVENPVLAYSISRLLDQTTNVTVEFGSKLQSCVIPSVEKPDNLACVVLDDNRIISTNLLIGADGFNSKVRGTMKSPYINFNYDRTAVVATLKLTPHDFAPSENNVAWQRFLPTGGPIALLPLSRDYSSLVWSTTPDLAKQLLELSSDDFVDAVNSAFWKEYPRALLVQKSFDFLSTFNLGSNGPRIFPPSLSGVVDKSRACFPLGFGHSAYYVSRRTALIGDAAHRVHPLAGQGLNLGLGDVGTLLRVLDKTAGLGGDIGNLAALQEYETERQRHNFTIQTGIDLLHRLYSNDLSPVVALRSVGLSLVNSSELLKKFIISQASA